MISQPALAARQTRERALHTRLLVSHETALEHHLRRVIAEIGHAGARMYRDHGRDGLPEVLVQFPGRLRAVLRPSLLSTARDFSQRLMHAEKAMGMLEHKRFDTLDSAIADWINVHTGARIDQITETMRADIQDIIRQGIEEGWSEAEIASAIEDATSGDLAGWRARRIARTETHTAANAGQYIAAQSSPLDYTKEWLATEDHRTREDHANANGQRVHLYASFILGGADPSQNGRFVQASDGSWRPRPLPGGGSAYTDPTRAELGAGMVAMLYPGDPAAPPEFVINCRCSMLLQPQLDTPEPQPDPNNPWDTGNFPGAPPPAIPER